jgi:hypothetical protein
MMTAISASSSRPSHISNGSTDKHLRTSTCVLGSGAYPKRDEEGLLGEIPLMIKRIRLAEVGAVGSDTPDTR